ncbi:MAG TPA: GNAT family N-acetyltransferase [Dehalococcoidia bacterium]|nr:GNAT family N-acetyltransferase [Dehalococcoidia bacterium]
MTALITTRTAIEGLRLRPLRFEEIPALAAALQDDVTQAQLEVRWREQELGFREIVVAEIDGQLAGTVSIHEPGDPPRSLHLFALEVGREWRRRGIGTALVDYVVGVARARGLWSVHLEVRADNPARKLYHRAGFRRVGQPFLNGWWRYTGDGSRERVEEVSVRMVKRLRPRGASIRAQVLQ